MSASRGTHPTAASSAAQSKTGRTVR
jgi:hypothetical protein